MLGKLGFHKGMLLYFQGHDGKVVTCEHSFVAMCYATNVESFKFLFTILTNLKTNYQSEIILQLRGKYLCT